MLATLLIVYVVAMYGLAIWASRKIETTEDYLVAGRRLPLVLASATLLATWFGAGTMLTAADEVYAQGLRAIALEPVGAGLCLVIAGVFFATRLWNMKLLTLSDFFARRFGPRAEIGSAFLMVPGYFGWIAVQFVALAEVLQLMFGLDVQIGIALVAAVGVGYTLLGGMWAVTITDAAQLALLLVGLVVLGVMTANELGSGEIAAGLDVLGRELDPAHLDAIPSESPQELMGWVSILLIAALGNLPGQDLLQRIFSSKSAATARNACVLAGVGYLSFGMIPVFLGLAAVVILPEQESAVVPALATAFFSPLVSAIFILALASAVLSTIDSAILSPASVISHNLLTRWTGNRFSELSLDRLAVLGVAAISVSVAYIGEDAYSLLEAAYEIGFCGLFVPLAIGTFRMPRSEHSALAAMTLGGFSWLLHHGLGWESFAQPWLQPHQVLVPPSLPTVVLAALVYLAFDLRRKPIPS